MKLIIAIVNKKDMYNLVDQLTRKNFPATKIESTGGFLKKKNATILVGVESKKVEKVLEVIKNCCHSRKEYIAPAPSVTKPDEVLMPDQAQITVGGATVFILDVERAEKL
jgi:uncharacterized protein YaaQ